MVEFNHLINIPTLLFTCMLKLPFNKQRATRRIFNINARYIKELGFELKTFLLIPY